MNTISVTVSDDENVNKHDFSNILPSTESNEYKHMLSMLGFNVELPNESKEDSEKFNIADYVVSTL